MTLRLLLALAIFGAALLTARADVVTLIDGKKVEGTVLEDSPDRVVIEVEGHKLTYARHHVKGVVKKPLPPVKTGAKKPRPRGRVNHRRRRSNLYSEMDGVVAVGDRWEFRHQRGEKAPTSESFTVTWLGLKELSLVRAASGPGISKRLGKAKQHGWLRLKRQRSWPPEGATRETLVVSGRSIDCVVIERELYIGGTSRIWTHIRDGRESWPRVVRETRDGVVVTELIRIRPAPEGTPVPPRDPGVSVGDVITKLYKGKKGPTTTIYTVRAACPTEVAYLTEQINGQSMGGGWRWNPRPVAKHVHYAEFSRETLTLDGHAYPCLVAKTRPGKGDDVERVWWHVGEDGHSRFPGVMRTERNGEVVYEVRAFERR
jgi:hypothetical protein